jgi:SAM-dependent methyltransferase
MTAFDRDTKKLNLGCGEFKKAGYLNLDYGSVTPPDIAHNLESIPYPFENDHFNLVEADHVLEHLGSPFSVMREIHRITENGGKVVIRTPHFSRGFTHPEHKRGFDLTFPLYFDPQFPGGYQGVTFELDHARIRWFAQLELKRKVLSPLVFNTLRTIGVIVDYVANLAPMVCSRVWCYWVGGFEEVEFHFFVRK